MSTTDTKAAFEAHYRKDCEMPDSAAFNWDAPYMVAALDGWQAALAWQAATEAAKATSVAVGKLPPLPEAIAGGPLHGFYTADQMREYGRSCEKGALARGAAAMAKDFAAREPMSRDHADCQSCVDGKCTTGDHCVTLGLDDDPLYWKQRALKAEAARQPAPALPERVRELECVITDLTRECNELRAALAATAAPVLSDERDNEIFELQKALAFWLPQINEFMSGEMSKRIAHDAYMLVIDGNLPDDFKTAQELGWILPATGKVQEGSEMVCGNCMEPIAATRSQP